MSWRIVYIEESDSLSLYLNSLRVKRVNDDITIPLSDINTIIVDNYKTSLTVQLINKCSEYNINIVCCGINRNPQSIIFPISGHFKSTEMLRKQVSWEPNILEFVWKFFVRAKIKNQIYVLKSFNKNSDVIEHIELFISEVQNGDKTNREGLAAKMYFRELFGDEFKRDSECVINYALNYGYSILRSMISKVLVSKGLNCNIGIFHRGMYNSFNLSDDFIEVYRPIIDYIVYDKFREDEVFTKEHRLMLIRQTTKDVLFNDKKQSIFNSIILFVESFLRFMESGDVDCIMFPKLIKDEL